MGSLSIWHWIVVIGVAAVLFGGRGKITAVMGDFAKGIKAFKSGMKEPEEEAATAPQPQVTAAAGAPAHASAAAPAHAAPAGLAAERPRDHL